MSTEFCMDRFADRISQLRRDVTDEQTENAFMTLINAVPELIPGAVAAGLVLREHGRFRPLGTSDATMLEELQIKVGSGPCMDGMTHRRAVVSPDLRGDLRWPDLVGSALDATGLRSVLSVPLLKDVAVVTGCVNAYAPTVNAFDEHSEGIGRLVAECGMLAFDDVSNRRRADNLMIALTSSRTIGVAMGVLMYRHKITREQAFDQLRVSSQRSRCKLAVIAADVMETGELPVADDLLKRLEPTLRDAGRARLS